VTNPIPTAELIASYGKAGPRYTSYPTVPYWSREYTETDYRAALAEFGTRAGGDAQDVSMYLHVPFCERRCTFCGCNVIVSRDRSKGMPYIDRLTREMDTVLGAAGGVRPRTAQMHWGGGTPTWLSPDELDELCRRIEERFEMLPDREQSIEVDPRVTTQEQLSVLRAHGLNRLSMGVQDFTPEVQEAIHRVQTVEQTSSLIDQGRAMGIDGINVDLIYGLPHQEPNAFAKTIEHVIDMSVDRVALYNFAYLPERMKRQRAILPEWLPTPEVKVELLLLAMRMFSEGGYRMIGLDHFAKETDELSRAQDDGTMQRNFMGYTTRAGRDLVAFGVSSISRVGRDFVQSVKETLEYSEAIDAGTLPVEIGMRLSDDDLLREHVIQSLMCYGRVDFDVVAERFGVQLLDQDPSIMPALDELAKDSLIEWEARTLRATPLGSFFLRNIAMAFDAYLGQPPAGAGKVQFSRTV
jgi:oxygen-independent coproporphyrinogen-3 oxidase